jgi:uncharacterized protein
MFRLLVVLAATLMTAPAAAQFRRPGLERECAKGDAAACAGLGEILEIGGESNTRAWEPNPRAAAALYEKACTAGHTPGCALLAGLHARGEGVQKDPVRAAALYTRACDSGDPGACLALAGQYERGEGVARDAARAAALQTRGIDLRLASCERGDGRDCQRLASHYANGHFGLAKDVPRALGLYERACALGDRSGCLGATHIYFGNTPGGPRDPERAKVAVERARLLDVRLCDAGNVNACWSLGTPEATLKACGFGDPDACFRLGVTYEPRHEGDTGDHSRAAHFFLKGCDLGEAGLCERVAEMHTSGQLPRDDAKVAQLYAKAIAAYDKACADGEDGSCKRAQELRKRRP